LHKNIVLFLLSFLVRYISAGKDKQDFYEQIPIILRELINRLNDDNSDVLKADNVALLSLSKNVPAEELVNHIEFIRNLLNSMVSDARRRKGGVGDGEFLLPGFNMPKGTLFCVYLGSHWTFTQNEENMHFCNYFPDILQLLQNMGVND
jgi:hypothetical protein